MRPFTKYQLQALKGANQNILMRYEGATRDYWIIRGEWQTLVRPSTIKRLLEDDLIERSDAPNINGQEIWTLTDLGRKAFIELDAS